MLGTRTIGSSANAMLVAVIFPLFLLLMGTCAAGMTLSWGEPPIQLPITPVTIGSTIMVPLEMLLHFNGDIAQHGDSYEVSLGDVAMNFEAGSSVAHLQGTLISMSVPAQERDGDLLVPLRTLADHLLGARISYRTGGLQLIPWSPLTGPSLLSVNDIVTSVSSSAEPQKPAPPQVRDVAPSQADPSYTGSESRGGPDVASPSGSGMATANNPEPLHQVASVPPTHHEPATAHITQAETVQDLSPGEAPVSPSDSAVEYGVLPGLEYEAYGQDHALSMSIYRRLDSIRSPRRSMGWASSPPVLARQTLPPIKPTALRAERLNWLETSLTQGRDGKDAVQIKGSQPFTYNTFVLTDPARLVIDIIGLDTGHASEPLAVFGTNIQRIRMNQNAPNVVRIVIDLLDTVGYEIVPSEDQSSMMIELNHVLRSVTGQFTSFSGTVRLDVPPSVKYEVLRLDSPDRLVVDLMDTTLVGDPLETLPTEGPIRNWRVQQFDPSRTRLVFEVDRHLDIAVDQRQDVLSFHVGHQVKGIGYASVPGVGLVVHVDGARLPDAQIMYLAEPDRLVIDLPGTVLPNPLQDMIIGDRLAWRIRSGQHPDMVRLVLDLDSSVEYEVMRLPLDQGLAVIVLPPSLAGRSVFLDPGHGDHDPGTMGRVLGLLEKDVVLDIAVRLRELLEAVGAKVFMSRSNDTFVDLNRRPAMAREAGADVFLSIHANAAPETNSEAGGTETFIYIRPNHPDNERFGAAVHRHLATATGLANRGLKQQNFAVLRNSFIPSALVEVAFLSRAEEEFLLSEEWFRQQIAQGLFNGVVAYFNEGASRAANLSIEDRRAAEEGILQALVKGGFDYLPIKGDASHDATVGAVRVQPL